MAEQDPPTFHRTKVAQDFSEFIASFGDAAEKSVRAERNCLELLMTERVVRVGSGIALSVIALFMGLIALLLAVLSGSKAWGESPDSEAVGYLTTSVVCAGMVLLLVLLGGSLKRWVKLRLINTLHGHE